MEVALSAHFFDLIKIIACDRGKRREIQTVLCSVVLDGDAQAPGSSRAPFKLEKAFPEEKLHAFIAARL